MAEARQILGIADPPRKSEPKAPSPAPGREPTLQPVANDDNDEVSSNTVNARRLWERCRPLTDTDAAMYLHSRGISDIVHESLRYHPEVIYREDSFVTRAPAMVAAIKGADGSINAVHRTWLDASGTGKANLPEPRKMLGPPKGYGVQFHPERADRNDIVVGEGIETVLSVTTALPGCAGIATLSSSVMPGIAIPESIGRVLIAVDRDKSGYTAAMKLEARLREEGRPARLIFPQRNDFNDDLMALGAGGLREHIQAQLSAPALQLPEQLTASPAPLADEPAAPEPVLTLSRGALSFDSSEFGLVALDETDRKELAKTIHFEKPPNEQQVRTCARAWADIAVMAARRTGILKVLVLADTWLIPPLERELRARKLIPVYPHIVARKIETASGPKWERKLIGIVPSLQD
ncbi:MAG: toprim domain-containing protein [Alphaproteobacteria bacterium]|nr:toprim domain-containing protein [Alphaproteobacteria bacterium]